MLSKYPKRSKDTASRVIDKEAVVVIPSEGVVRILNEVGSRVWQLSDGRFTVNDIINTITLEFEVSCQDVKKDVLDFISELKEKNMMVLSDAQNL